jgi:alpha/beta superfamily hydrolase
LAALLLLGASLHAQVAVSFSTSDGGTVSADLYGTGVNGLILAPGGRFDKSSWEPQARLLAEAGFRVIAINFRGRGESEPGAAGAEALHLDILGGTRYLRATGARSIAVVAASLGGWAAAEAVTVSEPGEVDRLVLLAAPPIDHPDRLTGKKLFIVSRGDSTGTGLARLDQIRRQCEAAPDPKELVVVGGSAHAQFLFQEAEGDSVMSEILRFLTASPEQGIAPDTALRAAQVNPSALCGAKMEMSNR